MTTPSTRGWYYRVGDPEGIQRWFDGRAWTNDTAGTIIRPAASEPERQYTPHPPFPPAPPAGGAPVLPYTNGRRIAYSLLWGFYTVVLMIGALTFAGKSIGTFLVGAVLAVLCGRYTYRIWTYKARRLLFLLVW